MAAPHLLKTRICHYNTVILLLYDSFAIKSKDKIFFSLFSRAAVVRGRVVTSNGMGLIGVRVSTTLPNEGFTMTRDDGWFDLMVNGGGSVMLQFGRNPYPPLRYLFLIRCQLIYWLCILLLVIDFISYPQNKEFFLKSLRWRYLKKTSFE